MKGRILLVIFFTFIPFVANGTCQTDITDCSELSDNPTCCVGQAGCRYIPQNGYISATCEPCPQGKYCPPSDNPSFTNDFDGSYPCPAPFDKTDANGGATSAAECYAEVTCSNNQTYTVRCGTGNPDDVCDYTEFKVLQWTFSHYNNLTGASANLTTRKNKEKFDPPLYVEENNFDYNLYHLEIQPEYDSDQVGNNPWRPKSSKIVCVPNNVACNEFGSMSCQNILNQQTCEDKRFCTWSNDTGCVSEKHMCKNAADAAECTDVGYCFYDQTSGTCSYVDDVSISPNSWPDNDNPEYTISIYPGQNYGGGQINGQLCKSVSGDAVWDQEGAFWDTTECRCNRSDDDYFTNNCINNVQYVSLPGDNAPKRIYSIEENIIFNNSNSISHNCTRCKPDTQTARYVACEEASICDNNSTGCSTDINAGIVCRCEGLPLGYTRIGTCNNQTDWSSPSDICRKQPCEMGKTTASTSAEPTCTYGDQTQICDNTGDCKSLSEFGNLQGWTDL